MAQLAEDTHPTSAVEAQQITSSAHSLNKHLPRPRAGIDYQRLAPLFAEQASACVAYVRGRFARQNEVIVAANAVADDLVFRPGSYKRFHRAIREAALFLGFQAQLPESEYGAGPDALWAVGGLQYFVIECKNEATTSTVNKKDCNQLAGSANWFAERYDKTCTCVPIMVHPSAEFERASTPPAGTRVMTQNDLPRFVEAFLSFAAAVSYLNQFGTTKEVADLLIACKLVPDMILQAYTSAPTKR